jgi:hypothetical protein
MKGACGEALSCVPTLEFVCKQDVTQLRLAVRHETGVLGRREGKPLELELAGCAVGLTRHHDHPSPTPRYQLGKKRLNEQEVSHMTHAHRSLDSSIDFLVGTTEDAGVADERVDRIGVDPLGEGPNALAGGQIQVADLGNGSRVLGERSLDRIRP